MSIISLEEFNAYFRNEIQDPIFLQACLDAADEGVQDLCQRQFVVAGSSSARTYVPRCGSDVLRIHDCTTVTSVVENGTTLTVDTHFQKEPVQTVSWAGVTKPYEQLRRLFGPWYTDRETGTVVVTATWGWAAVPASIKMACRVGAKDLADTRDTKLGIAAISEFGPLRVRENPAVQKLAQKFTRQEAYGVA